MAWGFKCINVYHGSFESGMPLVDQIMIFAALVNPGFATVNEAWKKWTEYILPNGGWLHGDESHGTKWATQKTLLLSMILVG